MKYLSYFLIITAGLYFKAGHAAPLPGDCFSKISEVTCHLNSYQDLRWQSQGAQQLKNAVKAFQTQKCSSRSEYYAQALEEVFADLPFAVQQYFCAIQKIYVARLPVGAFAFKYYSEQDLVLGQSSYFEELMEQEQFSGFVLVLDEESLFQWELSAAETETQRLQALYGWNSRTQGIHANLPFYLDEGTRDNHGHLKRTLVHEVGHFVDMVHGITRKGAAGIDLERQEPGNWAELGWKKIVFGSDQNSHLIPLVGPTVFKAAVDRSESLAISETSVFFEEFNQTSFVSLYSMVNPSEDFAETFAAYFQKGQKILWKDQAISDLDLRKTRFPLKGKMDFIKALLQDLQFLTETDEAQKINAMSHHL